MIRDHWGLVLSYLYVTFVVVLAELSRRYAKTGFETTRKSVHIAVGTWILPTLFLFDRALYAAIPPATFIPANLFLEKTPLLPSMHDRSERGLGTVWFPVSFVVLILWLWEKDRMALAGGILAMAWGDALGSLVGRRFGRHPYRSLGGAKSIEGSAAVLVGTLAALGVARAVTGSEIAPLALAIAACIATAVEALLSRGWDNLGVPLATAAFLHAVSGWSG